MSDSLVPYTSAPKNLLDTLVQRCKWEIEQEEDANIFRLIKNATPPRRVLICA